MWFRSLAKVYTPQKLMLGSVGVLTQGMFLQLYSFEINSLAPSWLPCDAAVITRLTAAAAGDADICREGDRVGLGLNIYLVDASFCLEKRDAMNVQQHEM